jgi:4-aminobutyrate aminotransferase-like enzyme
MFGIEHWNVDPDIMFLGKSFANGISMAGIIARKDIMEKEAEFPVVRGGSFIGNPIACVAAKATIEEILEKDLIRNSSIVGQHLMNRLKELQEKHESIGDVRGKGLLIGVELVKDPSTKEPATEKAETIVEECLKSGLLIGAIGTYKQVLRITPPLTLSIEEANIAVDILHESMKKTS